MRPVKKRSSVSTLILLFLVAGVFCASRFSTTTVVPSVHLSCERTNSTVSSEGSSQFPSDLFTLKQRQNGFVVIHLFLLIYSFIALAIVCDEFFVNSLSVLTERLAISDDVSGATFMAAGGSAPEFFTSLIGVWVKSNVGIGTIVGSATFNILCVLAFCALFSHSVLLLTWWPLFRDVTFYMVALLMLLFFFLDEQIHWYEAMSLFLIYILYCIFMKFNERIESIVKRRLFKTNKDSLPDPAMSMIPSDEEDRQAIPLVETRTDDQSHQIPVVDQRRLSLRRQSVPILHSGAMYRNGIIQLMSSTLEPLTEAPSICDLSSIEVKNNDPQAIQCHQHQHEHDHRRTSQEQISSNRKPSAPSHNSKQVEVIVSLSLIAKRILEKKEILEETEDKPLDIRWPDTARKRLIYLFLAPILLPLWLTLPDVRNPTMRRWYPVTFCGSVLWIAFFSYLMVWWTNTIGETLEIPNEVMGLTILAAGTSIPDLITSVIVARKGLGDMAVSSSVGSNIFDVCIGLPVPWLIYFIVLRPFRLGNQLPWPDHVSVSSNGLICSVGMLFVMLVLLVMAIGLSRWRMNKMFGVIMLISYALFCVIAVALETGMAVCPLRLC